MFCRLAGWLTNVFKIISWLVCITSAASQSQATDGVRPRIVFSFAGIDFLQSCDKCRATAENTIWATSVSNMGKCNELKAVFILHLLCAVFHFIDINIAIVQTLWQHISGQLQILLMHFVNSFFSTWLSKISENVWEH